MTPQSHKRRLRFLFASIVVAALVMLTVIETLPSRLGAELAPSTSRASPNTSNRITITDMVGGSFSEHMLFLAYRNASAIVSQFEQNASVTWIGQVGGGLTGTYIGTDNIFVLMNSSFVGRGSTFTIGNVTHSVVAASDHSATVNSSFSFFGRSDVFGNVSGKISARDVYVYSDTQGALLISQEIWNFLDFDSQSPNATTQARMGNETVDALSASSDGNYLAVGASDARQHDGSIYLVSLQGQGNGVAWRHATNGTTIDSIAISSDGSYLVARGYSEGPLYGHDQLIVFNKEGRLLWTFQTGILSGLAHIAISENGSRILADYGNTAGRGGILCFGIQGNILWNYTFPQRGSSFHFAMSRDGGSIVYAIEGIIVRNWTNVGWGVFSLDAQGHGVWNYTEENAGVNYVQMSSDGSHVAAGTLVGGYGGGVYYFDGKSGAMLWHREAYTPVQPLRMSSDGSHIAIGGNKGVVLFDSSGDILWNYSYFKVSGDPVSVSLGDSLVLLGGGETHQAELIEYNGTSVATFDIPMMTAIGASPRGSIWFAAEGSITDNNKGGGCATLHVYNGSSALPSTKLC